MGEKGDFGSGDGAPRRPSRGRKTGIIAAARLVAALSVALAWVTGGLWSVPDPARAQSGVEEATPNATAPLGGAYYGVDAAEGWRLTLEPVETGYRGLFVDHTGRETVFEAVGGAGSAVADRAPLGPGAAYLNFAAHPLGLLMVWIPIGEDGGLAVEDTQSFSFLRDGVALPTPPDAVAAPPIEVTPSFDAIAFLTSYEFWTPEEAGAAYASLTPRTRTLIRLFAVVQADILWKLCQAATPPPGLPEALEGQSLDCPAVLARVTAIQRLGAFNRYKSDVSAAKSVLTLAALCATGGLDEPRCREATVRTATAAASLATVASVLSGYGEDRPGQD